MSNSKEWTTYSNNINKLDAKDVKSEKQTSSSSSTLGKLSALLTTKVTSKQQPKTKIDTTNDFISDIINLKTQGNKKPTLDLTNGCTMMYLSNFKEGREGQKFTFEFNGFKIVTHNKEQLKMRDGVVHMQGSKIDKIYRDNQEMQFDRNDSKHDLFNLKALGQEKNFATVNLATVNHLKVRGQEQKTCFTTDK